MANIKISQLPSGVPTSSSVFPFVLSAVTYQGYVSALTTSNLVSLTLSEYNTLVVNNEILTGKSYLISGVDSQLYNDTTILVNGVTSNSSTSNGFGVFYNPKYDHSVPGNGVWNRYIQLSILNYTGTSFTIGETITSDLGGIATFIGGETLEWVNGTWTGSMFMTGNTSGTIAEITDSYFEDYETNDKVIWGGKVWQITTNYLTGEFIAEGNGGYDYSGYTLNNPVQPTTVTIYTEEGIYYDDGTGLLNGPGSGYIDYNLGEWSISTLNPISSGYSMTMDYVTNFIGNSTDKYNLSSVWSAITYNDNDYNVVVDEIEYDFVHDKIISRKDRFGNEVNLNYQTVSYFEESYGNPIKDFQWGNNLDNFGYGPSLYFFNDVPSSSDDIAEGGNGLYDNGNTLNTENGQVPYTHTQMTEPPVNSNLEASLPYFNMDGSVNVGDSYFGSGSQYFTNLFPGMFVMVAKNTSNNTFYIDGGVGADCSSELDSYTNNYIQNGNSYTAFVKRYYNYSSPKPSINHIIIVNGDGTGITHDYNSGGCDSDFDEISNLNGGGVNSIYYLTISLYPDEKIENPLIDSIVSNFLQYVDGVTISNILTGLSQNYLEITNLLTSNQTLLQLGVMGNKVNQSYFDCLNFLGGSIWDNEIKNQSIFELNLFSPNIGSTFSGNVITNGSSIYNNVFTEDSSVFQNYIDTTDISGNYFMSYTGNKTRLSNNEFNNTFFQTNNFYGSTIDNNELKIMDLLDNNLIDSTIDNNKMFSSYIVENTLVSSQISENIGEGNSNIELNILTGSDIQSNIINNGNIDNNILLGNSGIIYNVLKTFSNINNNYLSGNTFIQYNDLSSSEINSNTGNTSSLIQYNECFYGIVSANTVENSSTIQENEITQMSEISLNTLESGSTVNNNLIKNDSYIFENISQNSSEITQNYLDNGYIYENIISGSTISNNDLSVTSEIYQNELYDSNIWKNNLTIESSIFNGVFENGSFGYNQLKNTTLDFSATCVIDSKDIIKTNFIDTQVNDISENSNVIYDNYSKNVFTNSAGVARISYYDGTDLLVIGDLNDSILPGLVISSWSPTGQYSIDVTVNVTSDGGDSVTQRGVVWATNKYPTISDNILVDGGTGTGVYTESLTGLTSDSIIYFRGYAVNVNGTGYTCQDSYSTIITP